MPKRRQNRSMALHRSVLKDEQNEIKISIWLQGFVPNVLMEVFFCSPFLSFWRAEGQGKGGMGGSTRRIWGDGQAEGEEAEDRLLRHSRQEQRREGTMGINDVRDRETYPTVKIKSKIKTFHIIDKANCSTIHKPMISDTAPHLLPAHISRKLHEVRPKGRWAGSPAAHHPATGEPGRISQLLK